MGREEKVNIIMDKIQEWRRDGYSWEQIETMLKDAIYLAEHGKEGEDY